MENKKFWLVWREGGCNPIVKHKTKAEAETEARRLAVKERTSDFYVIETISVSRDITRIPKIKTEVLK